MKVRLALVTLFALVLAILNAGSTAAASPPLQFPYQTARQTRAQLAIGCAPAGRARAFSVFPFGRWELSGPRLRLKGRTESRSTRA